MCQPDHPVRSAVPRDPRILLPLLAYRANWRYNRRQNRTPGASGYFPKYCQRLGVRYLAAHFVPDLMTEADGMCGSPKLADQQRGKGEHVPRLWWIALLDGG